MEAGYYSNQHAWLSTTDPFRPGHEQQQPSTPPATQNGDEWGKASAIDLPDFVLGDLQASNASPSSTVSMQQLYQFPANGYFPTIAPFNMIPYNQTSTPSTWPQQNLPLSSYSTLNGATSSVGSSQQSQHQQQQAQQQQAPSQPQRTQQLSIDPALTTTSSSTSYSPPPSLSQGNHQSPPLQFSVPFQQQQQPQPQQEQQQTHQNIHSPVLAIPPMYLMQQHPQQQQRTLNPHQLMQYQFMYHSPMHQNQTPMQTNLTATSSQPPTPPPASGSNSSNSTVPPPSSMPASEPDPIAFKKTLDRLLSPSALSDAKTVRHMMDVIADFTSARVTPDMRIEIASRIRDNAGNTFFAAWARDAEAMVLLVSWLKAGVAGKDEGRWECTIMPLLHVLDRLPLTIGLLREHRLGKLTTALLKSDTVSPAIKDMASNISRKWRTLIEPSSNNGTKDKDASSSSKKVVEIEDKTKKRKLGDAAPRPPTKVAVVSSGTGVAGSARAVKVKKEKVVVTAVKDAKADASFFSAPKPKPKLPSFKKAPAGSTTSIAVSGGSNGVPDVAQPNNEDPFQQALKEMKGRSIVPVPPTTNSASSANSNKVDGVNGDLVTVSKSSTPEPAKNSRKRKSVSWAPEGHLEKVRLIERAVYEDDSANGTYGAHSIRDLERAEGAAMHLHLFEEVIDWYEPNDLEFPQEIDSTERGAQSGEKLTQEEREKNTLAALYFTEPEIPETPGEPTAQIAIEQVDSDVRMMAAGPEIQPFFQNAMSVSDLVGQLRANTSAPIGGYGDVENGVVAPASGDLGLSDVNNAFGVSGNFDLSKLDPNALSSLAASLGLKGFNFGTGDAAVPGSAPELNLDYSSQTAAGWGGYSHQQPYTAETGYLHDERDRDRDERNVRGGAGFRGRGSGRGFRGRGGFSGEFKSKRRCTFYAQGSCRYGDMCHFSHEGPAQAPGQTYYD